MPENNNHSDPIEDLFREKSEEYDISFHKEDWLDLEQRLDEADKLQARRVKRRWIAAAAVLLFALLGYFTYENYQQINRLNQQLSEQNDVPTQIEGNDTGSQTPAEIPTNSPVPAADSTQEETSQEPSSSEPLIAETPGESSTSQEKQQETITGRKNNLTGQFAVTGRQATALSISDYSCNECLVSATSVPLNNPLPGSLVYSRVQKRTPDTRENTTSASSPMFTDRSDEETATEVSSPLAVGLLMGPDLSTVGSLSEFTSPGLKFGVSVEYRLTQNLAVTGGVGQANVNYKAYGNEYRPPTGYWTNGIIADRTVAECSILEIPLNLKYDFLHFDQSRLYASAGLSSYIMLNEEYQFNYDEEYAAGLAQEWSGKTGTRHWFSNANLSVGYEIDLLRNWSLRAEPFVKMPLKRVGWGNVKLFSVGTSFSLNFKL